MKYFALIVGILEIVVGLAMLFKPSALPPMKKASGLALANARMYGAAAFSIGIYAILIATDFEKTELHHTFLVVFLAFHAWVALAVVLAKNAGEPGDSKVAILHGIFAVISAYFLFA